MPSNFLVDKDRMLFSSPRKIDRQYTQCSRLRRCQRVGWNFLFLGGTTLLTQSYRMSERFKVQATNDFMIFGLQAVGSLGAGMLLATLGWNGVLAFSLPWLLVLIPVLIYAKKYLSVPQS